MQDGVKFKLPNQYKKQQLMETLAERYPLKAEPTTDDQIAFYDTFDWRLFNKSLVLCKTGNELHLRRLFEDETLQQAKMTDRPKFVSDFPPGETKQQLESIVEMRALLKLAEATVRSTTYRMLNEDDKTVSRLVLEEVWPPSDDETSVPDACLWVKPVRGYGNDSQKVANFLEELGMTEAKDEDIYFKVLEQVGQEPGDYSSKLDIQLSPEMRTDEATKIILRFLLDVMKRNEAYIKKDIDTEFLHDYRVAVRRTRSALGQIKDVFPAEATARFKNDFRYIGKLSNQLRDLDVYLLNEKAYKAMLPATFRGHIDPLFDHLRQKRSKALKQVIDGLNSPEYAQILSNWEKLLDKRRSPHPSAPNADRPIIDLAQERIYKRYRRIIKSGKQILKESRDELLHSLRIECKKLRYLLEFFSSLFPPEETTTLIKQLKQLQNNLGDFNDLTVQSEYLQRIAEELPLTDDRQSRRTLLAIGCLIEKLEIEKQAVKDSFVDVFTKFASSKNKKLFRQLFAIKPGPVEK